MSSVGPAPSPDQAQMRRYLQTVYGKRSGYALLCVGTPTRTKDGKYSHSKFRTFAFKMPEEASSLLRAASAEAPQRDVYVTALLRDRPNRRVGDSRPTAGRLPWLDVDERAAEIEAQLSQLGLSCSVVDSAGLGTRRQIYIDVGEDVRGEKVAAYASALAKRFGTDTAGGNNKVLRLPGTLNHKPRVMLGAAPRLVTWLPSLNPAAVPSIGKIKALLVAPVRPSPVAAPAMSSSVRATEAGPPSFHACEPVLAAGDAFRKALANDGRHKALLSPLMQLLRAGEQGHQGVSPLVGALRADFIASVSDDRGGEADAGQEFDRALSGTGLSADLDAGRDDHSVCSCELTLLRALLDDASLFTSRGRRTERKIMQSLFREAEKIKSRRVRKSQRQIAEDAECTTRTVTLGLKRLQSNGLIEQRLNRGMDMTTVVLAVTRRSDTTAVPAARTGSSVVSLSRVGPTHPVFGARGLRGNQEMTFNALDV